MRLALGLVCLGMALGYLCTSLDGPYCLPALVLDDKLVDELKKLLLKEPVTEASIAGHAVHMNTGSTHQGSVYE